MENSSTLSDDEIAKRLDALSAGGTGVAINAIEGLVAKMPDTMSVTQLHRFLRFSSVQVGLWEAEYFFSAASSPNVAAKVELDAWQRLWGAWSDLLMALEPRVAEQVREIHRLTVAQKSIERSLLYAGNRPVRKLAVALTSKIAIGLDRLGFTRLARRMYATSLYPRGSVGRESV